VEAADFAYNLAQPRGPVCFDWRGTGPGFFTSISSNGTSNAIIWALSRAGVWQQPAIYLYAFNPDSVRTWNHSSEARLESGLILTANSNLVPVSSDGEVIRGKSQSTAVFSAW